MEKKKNSPLEGQVVVTQCDLIITSGSCRLQPDPVVPLMLKQPMGKTTKTYKNYVFVQSQTLKAEIVSVFIPFIPNACSFSLVR